MKEPVTFIQAYPPYNAGEVAGFSPEKTAALIEAGIAKRYDRPPVDRQVKVPPVSKTSKPRSPPKKRVTKKAATTKKVSTKKASTKKASTKKSDPKVAETSEAPPTAPQKEISDSTE